MSAVLPGNFTSPASPSPSLRSSGVVVLTGLSYLFVAWGFSYLDRRYNSFGLEGTLWLIWAALGFGAGALHVRKPEGKGGQMQWAVLGAVGGLLAFFPGFIIFNLLRWACLLMMVIIGARAAVMRTKRDFYFTLISIFVVSLMVGTHDAADWTIWFYLGPAWVFAGLALAWEHAIGSPISRWTKASMTLGFMVASVLLAALLFLFLPRPAVLGFGFLPPGTDTPGMFSEPAGGGGQGSGGFQLDAAAESRGGGGADASKGPGQMAGNGTAPPQPAGMTKPWRDMLEGMRGSLKDRFIPGWQRSAIEEMLAAAERFLDLLEGQRRGGLGERQSQENKPVPQEKEPKPQDTKDNESSWPDVNWPLLLLILVLLLVVGYLLWRRRYRIALAVALGGARLLASRHPLQSMRVSALSLKWCLRITGHQSLPGQSVREHWTTAHRVHPLAARWFHYAVEVYCAVRFGGLPATPQLALNMNQAVHGACDIVLGLAPDLNPAT